LAWGGVRVIDLALAAFFEGPVMMIFATRGAAGGPAIGRGVGGRVVADGREVEFYAGGRQWAEALGSLSVGDPVALTFCRPADYRTFQLKGPLLAIAPASPADAERSAAYSDAMGEGLRALGLADVQLAQFLRPADLLTLRVRPTAIFAQTPGPGAGEPLAQAAS